MSGKTGKNEFAYEAMRNLILYQKWKPGEIHSVVEVSNKLRVSRTPVAEAVKQLEAQGLVKTLPRKGFIVNTASVAEIRDLFEIKAVIEGLAARKAAESTDPDKAEILNEILQKLRASMDEHDISALSKHDLDLHMAIFKLTRSTTLKNMAVSLWNQGHSYVDWDADWNSLLALQEEHEQLIKAIIEGRACDARHIMEQHGVRYMNALLRHAGESSEYSYEQIKNNPKLAEYLLTSW